MFKKIIIGNLKKLISWFRVDIQGCKDRAYDWMSEVSMRGGIYQNELIPHDLKMTKTRYIKSKSGKPVSSLALVQDFYFGDDSFLRPIYIALYSIIAMLVISFTSFADYIKAIVSVGPGYSDSTIQGSSQIGSFALALGIPSWAFFLVPVILVMGFVFLIWTQFTKDKTKESLKAIQLNEDIRAIFGCALATVLMVFSETSFFFSVLAYSFPAYLVYRASRRIDTARAIQLRVQASAHNDTSLEDFTEEGDGSAKTLQIKEAIQDTSTFIPMGKALGITQKNGDLIAPEEGTIIGATLGDLSKHIVGEGRSGVGKSYYIRHLVYEIYKANVINGERIGLAVFDGKADLPFEVAPILDCIFHYSTMKNLCIRDGISPAIWEKVIKSANKVQDGGQNGVFTQSASHATYHASLIQDLLTEIPGCGFTNSIVHNDDILVAMSMVGKLNDQTNEWEHPILQLLETHPDFTTSIRCKDAYKWLQNIQPLLAAEDNVVISGFAQARSWIADFLKSENFRPWADSSTSDFNIEDVGKGLKVGVPIDVNKDGAAGRIIVEVLRTRLSNLSASRVENWRDDKTNTSFIDVVDECQDVMIESDMDECNKRRSRGHMMMYFTQSIKHLQVRFDGKMEKVEKLVSSFSHKIHWATDVPESDELFIKKCGTITAIRNVYPKTNAINYIETVKGYLQSPEFDSTHPELMAIRKSKGILKSDITWMSGAETGNKANFNTLSNHGFVVEFAKDQNRPEQPRFTKLDLNILQQAKRAMISVQRSGLQRVDVCEMPGLSKKEFGDQIELLKKEYSHA